MNQRAVAVVEPSSACSLTVNSRPLSHGARDSGGGSRSSREQSTGTIVTATKSDIDSENMTTTDELHEEDARDAGQEEQRHEDGDVREDRGQNRRPDLLAAFDRRLHARLALLHVPEGVLEDDDRGVDDHADAERQAAERHRVQREAGEVEQRERADDGDRNRETDDERRAPVAQEQEDDADDEERADVDVLA